MTVLTILILAAVGAAIWLGWPFMGAAIEEKRKYVERERK